MATDAQFFDALKYLGQSVKEYGLGRAVKDANERAKQIKAEVRPDMEKRSLLTDLASEVMGNLSAAGASPQMVALAGQNLQPPQYTSTEQMLMSGISKGDPATIKAARELEDEELKKKIHVMQIQSQVTADSQARAFAQQEKLQDQRILSQEKRAGASAQAAEERAANRPVPSSFVKPFIQLRSTHEALQNIYNKMKANPDKYSNYVGPVVGRMANVTARLPIVGQQAGEAANFQAELRRQIDQYRRIVTGAQGSFQEIQRIEQSSVDPTLDYKTLVSRVGDLLKDGKQAQENHLQSIRDAGYNTHRLAPAGETVTSKVFTPNTPAGDRSDPVIRARSFFQPSN